MFYRKTFFWLSLFLIVIILSCSTSKKGIFAIGDINTYEGKLKLILCGFHEATLAVHGAYRIIHPDKKKTLKYTTIQGVSGFD